jgi:hypothetical protein
MDGKNLEEMQIIISELTLDSLMILPFAPLLKSPVAQQRFLDLMGLHLKRLEKLSSLNYENMVLEEDTAKAMESVEQFLNSYNPSESRLQDLRQRMNLKPEESGSSSPTSSLE